ncbi:hypothetical protein TeGR_g7389, partial [Tetraparma gracilis]
GMPPPAGPLLFLAGVCGGLALSLLRRPPPPRSVSELIRLRRSVFPKQYSGEVIGDDVVGEILESARWAPNHKLTEPWRFVVFAGAGKDALGAFLAADYKASTPPPSFSQSKHAKKLSSMRATSHCLAIIVSRNASSAPEVEDVCSVAMAVQNMGLLASERGVGAYWSSAACGLGGGGEPGERAPGVRKFLGLGEGEYCIGWFFMGRVEGSVEGKGRRKGVESYVEWRR